ncbi:MAG: recombinase family protein [Deltaproteobacteria bacterium]|nr:recombinase family protein [Deltaproteobacteria bacterium]
MADVGYVRVSITQNDTRQLEGIPLDKVFREKISGKSIKRPELEKCIDYIREGDTLHVHSMDRLARNLKDLQNIVDDLTGEDVKVFFHKENLIFSGGEDPMSKLMLQIMGAVAEFERSMIKERQREGIALAKKKGKRFGPKPVIDDEKFKRIVEFLNMGMNKTDISAKIGVSRQTLYKALKNLKTEFKIKSKMEQERG